MFREAGLQCPLQIVVFIVSLRRRRRLPGIRTTCICDIVCNVFGRLDAVGKLEHKHRVPFLLCLKVSDASTMRLRTVCSSVPRYALPTHWGSDRKLFRLNLVG